jgi:hypothetical protein
LKNEIVTGSRSLDPAAKKLFEQYLKLPSPDPEPLLQITWKLQNRFRMELENGAARPQLLKNSDEAVSQIESSGAADSIKEAATQEVKGVRYLTEEKWYAHEEDLANSLFPGSEQADRRRLFQDLLEARDTILCDAHMLGEAFDIGDAIVKYERAKNARPLISASYAEALETAGETDRARSLAADAFVSADATGKELIGPTMQKLSVPEESIDSARLRKAQKELMRGHVEMATDAINLNDFSDGTRELLAKYYDRLAKETPEEKLRALKEMADIVNEGLDSKRLEVSAQVSGRGDEFFLLVVGKTATERADKLRAAAESSYTNQTGVIKLGP